LNILVVDDLEPVVRLLKGILSKYGQKVSMALSGEEAIRMYKESPFDLVICDLAMPHMDGWQVGKEIKNICREKGIPKTPFILLTGWGGQVLEKEKIIQSGVDGVVGKPVDIKGLMATVREVVEKAEAKNSL
jgi:CheY-like chemotaxis protein